MEGSFSKDIVVRIPGVAADKIDLKTGQITSLSTEDTKYSPSPTSQNFSLDSLISKGKKQKKKKKSKAKKASGQPEQNLPGEKKSTSPEEAPLKETDNSSSKVATSTTFKSDNSFQKKKKDKGLRPAEDELKVVYIDSIPYVVKACSKSLKEPARRRQVREIVKGLVSKAVYVPCPEECIPVFQGIIDDIILPVVFPLLFYNTGQSFASYDRDFLPWSDHKNIRICVPKYTLVNEQ